MGGSTRTITRTKVLKLDTDLDYLIQDQINAAIIHIEHHGGYVVLPLVITPLTNLRGQSAQTFVAITFTQQVSAIEGLPLDDDVVIE
jgi:hypothetical protein